MKQLEELPASQWIDQVDSYQNHHQPSPPSPSHFHHLQGSPEVCNAVLKLSAALQRSRRLLREVGESAQVPIEPASQTQLIDASLTINGVMAAAVPGGKTDVTITISI